MTPLTGWRQANRKARPKLRSNPHTKRTHDGGGEPGTGVYYAGLSVFAVLYSAWNVVPTVALLGVTVLLAAHSTCTCDPEHEPCSYHLQDILLPFARQCCIFAGHDYENTHTFVRGWGPGTQLLKLQCCASGT